jgi:hypothetical protein
LPDGPAGPSGIATRRHIADEGGPLRSDLDALTAILGSTTIRTKRTIDQIAARHFA